MAQRSYGLGRLIDEAQNRPPHRPPVSYAHLADEYAAISRHAGNANGHHTNKMIAQEIRRPLSRKVVVVDGVTVTPNLGVRNG